jgi:hypothetical protein
MQNKRKKYRVGRNIWYGNAKYTHNMHDGRNEMFSKL